MNTSKYVQNLEDVYCHTRSAVTSAGLSCGSASLSTRIIDGGKKVLYTAAMTGMLLNNTIPAYAGNLTVSAGQTSTGLTVGRYGNIVQSNLFNYGSTIDTVVNSAGTEYVYSGGVATNTTINSGGYQYISGYGVASNTTISSDGKQVVSNRASAISTTVNQGGYQYVSSGGSAIDTTISNGGSQYISNGGSSINTIISSGGMQYVSYGGEAINDVISQGGKQFISNGGNAISTNINNFGSQIVLNGGEANNVSINSNGRQYISNGGNAISTIVSSAGMQFILNGGSAMKTTLSLAGAQLVSNGGSAISTTVNHAWQNIYDGGTAINTIINGDGNQTIYNNGVATNTTINNYGSQVISSGGRAIDTTVNSRGSQFISNSGMASNTIIFGSQMISNGGSAIDTTVNDGIQYVDGGVATNTTLNDGHQFVWGGGSAISAVVNSGAFQTVYSNATAIDTVVNVYGQQHVYDNGSAINTTLTSMGRQYIFSAGSAVDTNISWGGRQYIYPDGSAINTTIDGGYQVISSGGTADTVLNNGVVSVYEGGSLIDYSGNGDLYVYDNNTLSGTTDLGTGQLILVNDTSANLNIENLSANNAVVSMGVNLENQTADTLTVQSSYNGTTQVALRNTGTVINPTSEGGIKLIDFGNTATISGTFDLVGGQWDEGGYVYKMSQNTTDNDYYLRNTGSYSDTFKTMANVPMLNVVVAKAGMNSLNIRMGDLRDMSNPAKKQGVWARTYYKDSTVEDLLKTDMSLFGVEAGYDWLFRADEPTKLYAGVMVGYMKANSIKTKNVVGDSNSGKGEAPSIGIYATLANESGWFIDLAARNFWSKIENTTVTAADNVLKFDSNRNLITGSLEVGKTFTVDNGFKVEPKVEVSYINVNKETTTVTGGTGDLEYDAENYLTGKAAVMFAYKKEMSNQKLIEPLIELAYKREFAGKGKVRYGGAETETSLQGGSFEASVGLSMQLADNLYWHALGSYEKGNKLSGWGLNAGIRLGFGGDKK